MAAIKPSVLLIGASGAIGGPVTDQLILQKHEFSRIGILADPTRAAKFEDRKTQGVEVVVGSFYDANAYKGFDTLISLVGNDLMTSQVKMFAAALASGSIEHIYPSEYNSDLSQPELRPMRYFRDKYTVRDWLDAEAEINKEKSFKVTLLETGIFTEWAVGDLVGVDMEKKRARVYGKGEHLLSVTSIPNIAQYLVSSILLPFSESSDVVKNTRTVRVVGETLSYQRLLSELAAAQGATYDIAFLDPAEANAKEREAKQDGNDLEEMMWSLRTLAASGFGRVVGGGMDNEKFGFRPENVRQCFERVFGKGRMGEEV